jgi:hypothetical protein
MKNSVSSLAFSGDKTYSSTVALYRSQVRILPAPQLFGPHKLD